MKFFTSTAIALCLLLTGLTAHSQEDKSKRPSPPAFVKQTVGELTISVDYSQPSLKGRTIGKDMEPLPGKVWRTGANEATVFEVSKDVTVEGKALPAGKYGLFTLVNGDEWTIIFNKTWDQWGAFSYKEEEDQLRVTVKAGKTDPFAEKFTITISETGTVALLWGEYKVEFSVK